MWFSPVCGLLKMLQFAGSDPAVSNPNEHAPALSRDFCPAAPALRLLGEAQTQARQLTGRRGGVREGELRGPKARHGEARGCKAMHVPLCKQDEERGGNARHEEARQGTGMQGETGQVGMGCTAAILCTHMTITSDREKPSLAVAICGWKGESSHYYFKIRLGFSHSFRLPFSLRQPPRSAY